MTTVRRNIVIHGAKGTSRKGSEEARERDAAEEEAEKLRGMVRRMRRDVKAKMAEVGREEGDRKLSLDERASARHKQVMLEAYDQQCDEAAKIFAEYQRRLHQYVNEARDIRRLSTGGSDTDTVEDIRSFSEKETVYSTVKGNKSSEDTILIETSSERNIRLACESIAAHTIERIRNTFPSYEGSGVNLNNQLEDAKLSIELDGDLPEDIKAVALDALRTPSLLLQSLSLYTSRISAIIHKECEKIDTRADAELLRYKYESGQVVDVASPDVSSPLPYQVYGNGKSGNNLPTKGNYNQLLERQKAHVQQFLATEDANNKAAEAKRLCQTLTKRLHGSGDVVSSHTLPAGGAPQNIGNNRHFELEVWSKEREVAGLKASLITLTSEVQRLKKLCAEWKEAEDSLRKKWRKIEEFDARRSELESIHTALLRANMDASTYWEQQPLAAREYACQTIIPACTTVADISTKSKDLIEREFSAFSQSLDNNLYMLPSTPQALIEAMGTTSASTGGEALAAAEKSATILTARAGARDPSAIPSICRISNALQNPTGVEGSDAALASVLGALEFCLKPRGSEASVLEDLSKAINLVHTKRNLVENYRVLLNHAQHVQQDYDRMANYCLKVAADQENVVNEIWLPELKKAVLDAQRCLDDCQRVRGLVDEWWEQPAATAVDWVTVDGQNVGAWLNHVKQLQMAFYDQQLL